MNRKVLILCTGNSCRSIIAEALINKELDGVSAYSSGVNPTGRINPNAKRVLKNRGAWRDEYCSKTLDTLEHIEFDLVVTVCNNAKESCPTFPKSVPTIHIGFDDPNGKDFEAFEKTYKEIKEQLLPIVKRELMEHKMEKSLFKTTQGVKINFRGVVKKEQIVKMVQNCATGACECMSDETKEKITNMEVEGKDGNVELKLSGNISKEEIEKALSKSKVLK